MKSKFALLIVSCDKYSDLWEPFFECLWRQWPKCPYPIYLLSNTKRYNGKYKKRVTTLLSGNDTSWSTSLKNVLKHIPETYIFTWNEDLFISKTVDTKLFHSYFESMKKEKAMHIHYRNLPRPDRIHTDPSLGVYEKGMPYRSIVMGFWDKKYLYNLLLDGETPWAFEIMGSYRTSNDDGFYSAMTQVLSFAHMVEKGRWLRNGVTYCYKNNIPIDISARPLTSGNNLRSRVQIVYFALMLIVPWKTRLTLMNLLRKLLVSY